MTDPRLEGQLLSYARTGRCRGRPWTVRHCAAHPGRVRSSRQMEQGGGRARPFSRTRVDGERTREQHVLKGRMRNRKLAMGVIATAVFGAGVAISVLPASAPADPRTLVVTLATGQTLTVTVDVPPGTPLDQIKIPGISTPIVGISDVSPPPSSAPADQPTVPQAPSASVGTTPEAPSAAPQDQGQ